MAEYVTPAQIGEFFEKLKTLFATKEELAAASPGSANLGEYWRKDELTAASDGIIDAMFNEDE